MFRLLRGIRMPLSTKVAAVGTVLFACSGICVLGALLALSVSAPLTPVDIVWLMACCAALFLPLYYFLLNYIGRELISRPLEELTQTAHDLGSAPLPTRIPVEDELDALAVALVRSGESLSERLRVLRDSNGMLNALLTGLPGFVSVQDRSFRVVYCNATFTKVFNTRPGDSCRRLCNRPAPGGDCPVAQTFADGQPRLLEENGAYPDGTHTRWLVATAPVKAEDGTITHCIELRLDMTTPELQ
ncbi:PAS domain-containing protein [Desulfovibrio subterraneus]|uniref:HAMP domain-containing protein n=1 Tax=Desulfovibrio subterraneus TaxID=2718620 RepID=A0A7J0BGN0_9BACT|nr:PAS domain-containing protein [Desulfovibrio subterraneus]WBF66970.1 PAS domain-containing protein [Desulfovibrio subterraneus]GFM32698.1 hypothetical protein DSM101010T_10630 [Desulfovibrio subterraneus]